MKKLMWALVAFVATAAVTGAILLVVLPRNGDDAVQDAPATSTRPHGTRPRSGGQTSSSSQSNPVASSGKQTYHLTEEGVDREFIVYRPASVPASQELPVVFMYHGTAQSGELMYKETGWVDQANANNFMVVFPTSLKYHIVSQEKLVNGTVQEDVKDYTTKWNYYDLYNALDPAYPDQKLADDVQFTRDMVAFVKDNYATDAERIYATGFSNGGSFTAQLAAEMSDTFAAFAISSSGQSRDDLIAKAAESNAAPRPLVHVIGSEDPKLTLSAGVESFSYDESAAEDGNAVKDTFITGWLEIEKLADTYTFTQEDAYRAGHFTYSDSLIGADNEYQLYLIKGMGHMYPNGENIGFDVTDIYWPFFNRFSL